MPLKIFQKHILITILFLCAHLNIHAGAWPNKMGHGKAAVATSFLKAKSVSDGQGNSHNYALQEWGLATFGETGVLPSFDLGWSWGFLKSVQSDSMNKLSASDPEINLTYHFGHQGAFYFAAELNTRIPIASENSSTVPSYVYAFFSQQEWAILAKPVIGWSRKKVWMQASLGPKFRTGDFSSQGIYNLAGGSGFAKTFSTMLAFSGIVPLESKDRGNPDDQENYYGFQLAVADQIFENWSLGIQWDGMVTLGQGMPTGSRVNLFTSHGW